MINIQMHVCNFIKSFLLSTFVLLYYFPGGYGLWNPNPVFKYDSITHIGFGAAFCSSYAKNRNGAYAEDDGAAVRP